jgi:hypothetical protein
VAGRNAVDRPDAQVADDDLVPRWQGDARDRDIIIDMQADYGIGRCGNGNDLMKAHVGRSTQPTLIILDRFAHPRLGSVCSRLAFSISCMRMSNP